MLRLKYGSFIHDAGECIVRRSISPRYSQSRQIVGFVERWDIEGEIIDAAYATQGLDLSLIDAADAVLMSLPSSTSIQGTRTTKPSIPDGSGAEWATGLKYALTVEAEYETATDATLVVFQESVSTSGGGPVHVWRRPLNSPPIKQTASNFSPYQLVQSGFAVARGLYPSAPSPLFPADLWVGPEIRRTSPEHRSGQNQLLDYRIDWTYRMQAVNPFIANPSSPV